MAWLYNLLFPLAFILLLPGYLRRMVRRGHYQQNFGQRFGFYAFDVKTRLAGLRGACLIQAVSVGEMLVALKLLTALRAADPGLPIVVSTTTTTGFALASSRVPPGVEVIYTPIDAPGAVRRTFAAVAPAQVVIVDGGLWPNQLWEAARRRTPTALVNARLSPRSERRFRRFLPLAKTLFKQLDLVGVPDESDKERWIKLGVPANRLHRTGSIKFDDLMAAAAPRTEGTNPLHTQSSPSTFLRGLGVPPGTPILLAASTHAGEERLIGETFIHLRAQNPAMFLIIAPRHVERTSAIKAEMEALGLQTALRTDPEASSNATPDLLLLNTTGELRAWYPAATLAIIGKSLVATGGQNPAEAVMADVPVVFGTHMENFAELASALLAVGGAVQVDGQPALEEACRRLLADGAERARMTVAAREQILVHRGASVRTAALLLAQRRDFACQAC